jgi:hypothetical protein
LKISVEGIFNQVSECGVTQIDLVTSCSGSLITSVINPGVPGTGAGVYDFSINDSRIAQTITFNTKITFDGGEICSPTALSQVVELPLPCTYSNIGSLAVSTINAVQTVNAIPIGTTSLRFYFPPISNADITCT